MVRGATPDVVLTGVELLATAVGEVVVVDVGGATTDVHSVVELDPEQAGWPATSSRPRRSPARSRATSACAGRRSRPSRRRGSPDLDGGRAGAGARPRLPAHHRPGAGRGRGDRPRPRSRWPCGGTPAAQGRGEPRGPGRRAHRHRPARGRPGRRVRRRAPARPRRASPTACSGRASAKDGDWQLPERARVVVDSDYVLAAAGLLAAEHPDAAYRLVTSLLAVVDRLTP